MGFSSGDEARSRRTILFAVAIGAFFTIGLARLVELQVFHGSENRMISDQNRFRRELLRAPRGAIRDRQGRPLVENFPSFTLTINPHDASLRSRGSLSRVIGRISHCIEADSAELVQTVATAQRKTFLPVRLRTNLNQTEVARIEEMSAELPGVRIRVEPMRRYPHGKLAAHLLGYLGEISPAEYAERQHDGYEPDDQVGQTAIEAEYDSLLHGRHGMRLVEVDAFGRARGASSVVHPVPGADVILTVDLDLQAALESALDRLDEIVVERDHVGEEVVAAAVAMHVLTGEILALVSRPAFDPAAFASGIDAATWREVNESVNRPLLNRVTQAAYPPGSVFKMAVAAAALDSGLVTPSTVLRSCHGSFQFGSRAFRCWRDGGHGSLDLWGALEQSCDVYFYSLGLMLGVDGIASTARTLGLGEATGVDLPSEAAGAIPDSLDLDELYGEGGWTKGAAINFSIGQGEILTTPIGLLRYTAAIANDGHLVRPHLLRRVWRPERVTDPLETEERVLEPELARHFRTLRAMMGRVVEGSSGTGRRGGVDSLHVAGKTGTAQNPHGEDHALFVSFAPVEAPEVALVVVVEQRGHGGTIAAPVAHEFWEAYKTWRRHHEEFIG